MEPKTDWLSRLETLIWGTPDTARSRWHALALRWVRTVLILARDLAFGQLTLRAMSLVYTTLLSIVPLLALSFSVLKAFGVYSQIEPLLLRLLTPLGDKGVEVANQIAAFIENMNVGVLGALGLTLLLYTAISLMQKIEESLNYVWHISRPRSLGERFSRYLSVLMVGPILVFSALGLTGTMLNIDTVRELMAVQALGDVLQAISRLVPYLLVIAAFTFVYLFIPNTQVRFWPALVGGVVGGIVWQTAGWLFAVFVVSSGQYAAIYSGFAILILFMIWLYVSWLVLLFGASVAFYVQHPEYLYLGAGEPRLSNRVRERLALSVMSLVAERFIGGERAASLPEFTRLLGVPMHVLERVLDALEQPSCLPPAATNRRCTCWRATPGEHLSQVLGAVRSDGEARFFAPDALPTTSAVEQALERCRPRSKPPWADQPARSGVPGEAAPAAPRPCPLKPPRRPRTGPPARTRPGRNAVASSGMRSRFRPRRLQAFAKRWRSNSAHTPCLSCAWRNRRRNPCRRACPVRAPSRARRDPGSATPATGGTSAPVPRAGASPGKKPGARPPQARFQHTLHVVVDEGNLRRHAHAHRHAGLGQRANGAQAPVWRGRARLQNAREFGVQRGDGDVHGREVLRSHGREQIEIALHAAAFGDDGQRVARIAQHLQRGAGQRSSRSIGW